MEDDLVHVFEEIYHFDVDQFHLTNYFETIKIFKIDAVVYKILTVKNLQNM